MCLICDANFEYLIKVLFIATILIHALSAICLVNIIVILIQQCLLSTLVPYTVLDPDDITVIKTHNSCFHRVYILSWTYILYFNM